MDEKITLAELVGGPLDGVKIAAPEPAYRKPIAMPLPSATNEYAAAYSNDDEEVIDGMRLHWYAPVVVKNLSEEMFYYAYAGETAAGDPAPDTGAIYDRATTARPQFPKEKDNN